MDAVRSGSRPTWTLRLAAATMVVALIAAFGPPTTSDAAPLRVVVEATSGMERAAEAVASVAGRVHRSLDPLGMLVADVPVGQVHALRSDVRAGAVTADRQMQVQSDGFAAASQPAAWLQTVGAPQAWSAGATGDGIGIAIVDTGVSDHPDLRGRVVAAFDLSGEDDRQDSYGHGTFLAGIAAGDGSTSEGRYPGVAPQAHLVSVKVAGADGVTTLSQVLAGLAVTERTSQQLGVRVVMLALSGPAGTARDPLQVALDRLWSKGLFVVVAAGNDGPQAGSVGSPGVDPYVLTVGALDDAGTATVDDDTVPAWSSVGPTPTGQAKPDVLAPGSSIVSLRAPGSTLDRTFPTARVGGRHLRGSGTSMSTAMVAGAAAAVLQANPQLTPDEIKGRLMATADPAPAGSAPAAVGDGVIDLPQALTTSTDPANKDLPRRPASDLRDPGSNPSVDQEVTGWRWAGDDWSGWRWAGDDWSGWRWAGDDWSGWRWAGNDWSGWRWAGDDWSGWRWAGFVGVSDGR